MVLGAWKGYTKALVSGRARVRDKMTEMLLSKSRIQKCTIRLMNIREQERVALEKKWHAAGLCALLSPSD